MKLSVRVEVRGQGGMAPAKLRLQAGCLTPRVLLRRARRWQGSASPVLGVLVAIVLWVQPAVASDNSGPTLACIGTDTFYPMGVRWAPGVAPANAVDLHFDGLGPVADATGAWPGPAKVAVQAAFAQWTGASCPGSAGRPSLAFNDAGDWPTHENGDDPATGTYNNVVFYVVEAAKWQADSSTIALTRTSSDAAGTIRNADMAFNNVNFGFRTSITGGARGCNAVNPNCYDLTSVALHEVGHFIGLGHVACKDALMYEQARGNTVLSHHEVAAVCALYPPRASTTTQALMGEACVNDGACAQGLTCLRPPDAAPTAPAGWCAKSCSSSSDCAIGWVCGPYRDQGDFCYPGVHLSGVPVGQADAAPDLCAPCVDQTQCGTGLCAAVGSGLAVCTQQCNPPTYACPPGYQCVSNPNDRITYCLPADPIRLCPSFFTGSPTNEVCYSNGVEPNPTSLQRACTAGDSCFMFPSGFGACVASCSSTDPASTCAAGFRCCFGMDNNGHCMNSTAQASMGGCFQLRHVGDSCQQPTQYMCDASTLCVALKDATLSKCFHVCPNNAGCADGESCQTLSDATGQAVPVCCDAATYDAKRPETCLPKAGPCLRQVGVVCTSNADCESQLCLKNDGKAVCSTKCSSDRDCPDFGIDVNDDGVPDGGSKCVSVGSMTACWPTNGPAAAPACATSSTPAPSSSGCGCTAMGTADAMTWLLGASLAWLARRRRA